MKEEFLPFEESMQLKELGFDMSCFVYHWSGANDKLMTIVNPRSNTELISMSETIAKGLQGTDFCSAPLFQQVFRWFREEYGYNSHIDSYTKEHGKFGYVIYNPGWIGGSSKGGFDTYEEAELACIKELIRTLKDKQD